MLTLEQVLDPLAQLYGEPEPPPQRTLFELVLLENIAYLVDDARRMQAFETLRTRVGATPEAILRAPDAALLEATTRGIVPEHQAEKLRSIATITLTDYDGNLES